jgi:hypothetical protein
MTIFGIHIPIENNGEISNQDFLALGYPVQNLHFLAQFLITYNYIHTRCQATAAKQATRAVTK